MTFAQPLWLLLLLFIPLLVRRHAKGRGVLLLHLSQAAPEGLPPTWRVGARAWLLPLRWLAIGLLTLGLARPQRHWQEEKVTADALDIVLALDISPSMLNRDFNPNRLAAAKKVAIDFVEKRPHDRIGLVAFAGEAFTQCPLTTDRRVVQAFIRELQIGRVADGTAIGLGLATAVNRLKDSRSNSKIVVLLTDGVNNVKNIQPLEAAELARALGVKVYTIGVGTEGDVLAPSGRNADGSYTYDFQRKTFDPQPLEEIAALTGAKFYRARSEAALGDIYSEIDRLEKTKVEVAILHRKAEFFYWFVGAAVIFLLFEMLLRWTVLRTINI